MILTAIKPQTDLAAQVREAVDVLCQGGLVAFPTETVYGLGADAMNPEALARLYQVKGRPVHHPIIVHLAELAQMEDWATDIPDTAWAVAEAFWPGPLTLILPRAPHVLDHVTGGQNTIGLRIPNHPVALALLTAFGEGIAAPSANRFGKISPTTAAHVAADLDEDVDVILDGGPCTVGVESTIVDMTGPQPVLLRPGMIGQDQLQAVIGAPILQKHQVQTVTTRAPGTLKHHYAPNTPVELVSLDTMAERIRHYTRQGQTLGVLTTQPRLDEVYSGPMITAPANPEAYAQYLYGNLRKLDKQHCDRILVEAVPNEGLWQAIADRLQRAAAGSAGAAYGR